MNCATPCSQSFCCAGFAWHVVRFSQIQKNGDVHARGRALEIWQRIDGEWKMHRLMAPGVISPSEPLNRPSTDEPALDRSVN